MPLVPATWEFQQNPRPPWPQRNIAGPSKWQAYRAAKFSDIIDWFVIGARERLQGHVQQQQVLLFAGRLVAAAPSLSDLRLQSKKHFTRGTAVWCHCNALVTAALESSQIGPGAKCEKLIWYAQRCFTRADLWTVKKICSCFRVKIF